MASKSEMPSDFSYQSATEIGGFVIDFTNLSNFAPLCGVLAFQDTILGQGEFIRLQPLQASTWPLQKLKAWAANICHSWQNLESLMCSVSASKGKCNDRI